MRVTAAVILFCTASLAFGQRPESYRNPRGRFAVEVPAGWKATALPVDDAAMLMNAIARQVSGPWRNFTEARQGDTRLAGRAGSSGSARDGRHGQRIRRTTA
jgi:hypothetical protein